MEVYRITPTQDTPKPHYLTPGKDLVIQIGDNTITIEGSCTFPSSDESLGSRNHVNHFHNIIQTVGVLNVMRNTGHEIKKLLNRKTMLSTETKTTIHEMMELDKEYLFKALVSIEGKQAAVSANIFNEKNKVVAETVIKAIIK